MNMTAKERALKSPESTEDVPRNKQIVRFKNDGTSMSIDKAGKQIYKGYKQKVVIYYNS